LGPPIFTGTLELTLEGGMKPVAHRFVGTVLMRRSSDVDPGIRTKRTDGSWHHR
jgi:hypothetical protein